jgi:hypothetical protein
VRTSTCLSQGLLFFKPNMKLIMWKNWRTWPHFGVAMDLGSDGNSGAHGLLYKYKLCMTMFADPSHGGHRSLDVVLKQVGLFGFWILMLISWNLPHGPDKDDGRYHQIRGTMKELYKTADPKKLVLFQSFVPWIRQQLVQAGYEFAKGLDIDVQIWAYLKKREAFVPKGYRTNMNRFQGTLKAALDNRGLWAIDC